VRQEQVQDIFIRAVFGKRRSVSAVMNTPSVTDGMKMTEDKGSDSGTSLPEPVRIIHKEQDSISAFCLNQVINWCVCVCARARARVRAWMLHDCDDVAEVCSLSAEHPVKQETGASRETKALLWNNKQFQS
jgi:hypothetical protein